jgi:fumarate reductase subunit D
MSRNATRRHASYGAFIVHRASGLLLTLFLPAHFWALGKAIEGEAALQSFLYWAEHPLLKLSEFVLVILLAAHLAGGVRLLAFEFLSCSAGSRTMIASGLGFVLAIGGLFLLNLL